MEEEDGGDSGAAEDEALPDGEFPKHVASHYGANTPTSKGKRRTSLNAKCIGEHRRDAVRSVTYASVASSSLRIAATKRNFRRLRFD